MQLVRGLLCCTIISSISASPHIVHTAIFHQCAVFNYFSFLFFFFFIFSSLVYSRRFDNNLIGVNQRLFSFLRSALCDERYAPWKLIINRVHSRDMLIGLFINPFFLFFFLSSYKDWPQKQLRVRYFNLSIIIFYLFDELV